MGDPGPMAYWFRRVAVTVPRTRRLKTAEMPAVPVSEAGSLKSEWWQPHHPPDASRRGSSPRSASSGPRHSSASSWDTAVSLPLDARDLLSPCAAPCSHLFIRTPVLLDEDPP